MLADARTVSERVFNAPYRLEISAAIHRIGDGPFTTAEIQALLAEPLDRDNNAGRNLKKLVEAGLLIQVDKLWQRRACPLWEFCETWLTELVGQRQH